jgi:hypothetical protein
MVRGYKLFNDKITVYSHEVKCENCSAQMERDIERVKNTADALAVSSDRDKEMPKGTTGIAFPYNTIDLDCYSIVNVMYHEDVHNYLYNTRGNAHGGYYEPTVHLKNLGHESFYKMSKGNQYKAKAIFLKVFNKSIKSGA